MAEESIASDSSASMPQEPATGPQPTARVIVEAIYQHGVIKPLKPLDLPPGTPLFLEITTHVTVVAEPRGRRSNGAVEIAAVSADARRQARNSAWQALRGRLALAP